MMIARICLLLLLGSVCQAEGYFLKLKGKPVQGALLIGQTNPGAKVIVEDKNVAVTEDGYFMFGFGRFDEQAKNITITHQGQKYQTTVPVSLRDFPTEVINGLPKSKVNPPQQDWDRIKREQAEVKSARQAWSEQRAFLQQFIWPAEGRISGVYGSRRILNGEPKRPHYGMDIANKTGTPIIAPADGIVTMAVTDHFYTGGTVIIDHGYGLNSTYLHMSQVNVEAGTHIKQGEKIGEIGATGRATGPHLDWRLNIGTSLRLDPELIIPKK
ncbi:M23 family metallopeptidase [Marinicella rhabdoformis]|uniref:M23 family metallopeptidase n=1 Tax=Marinicella rhabdoformis TaxID=2580566 RepID=UPI001FEC87D1|nr:M23 family metallopeptidase [Marinicella rhabdoformis]